ALGTEWAEARLREGSRRVRPTSVEPLAPAPRILRAGHACLRRASKTQFPALQHTKLHPCSSNSAAACRTTPLQPRIANQATPSQTWPRCLSPEIPAACSRRQPAVDIGV